MKVDKTIKKRKAELEEVGRLIGQYVRGSPKALLEQGVIHGDLPGQIANALYPLIAESAFKPMKLTGDEIPYEAEDLAQHALRAIMKRIEKARRENRDDWIMKMPDKLMIHATNHMRSKMVNVYKRREETGEKDASFVTGPWEDETGDYNGPVERRTPEDNLYEEELREMGEE